MFAAFDFPRHALSREDGERLRGAFSQPPARWLRAYHLDEVAQVIDAAWRASVQGAWVLGGVRYEAAAAFDAALATHASAAGQPLAEFAVFEQAPEPWPQDLTPSASSQALNSDWQDQQADAAASEQIERIREWIRCGDCYQVNLTTRLHAQLADGASPWQLFRALHAAQPGGFSVFLQDGEQATASVSPELFFDWRPSPTEGERTDWQLAAQPMKGTAPRGRDVLQDEALAQYLRTSVKERAENLMIVDLLRNDMGRLARMGSVRVPRLFELHPLSTVWQMTSTVTAHTPQGTQLSQVFAALFPCGSVTGAPKVRAMQIIAELEGTARGFYCGALGLLQPGGAATFNVPIRTVEMEGAELRCGIGSAITLDSEAALELDEWRAKSRFLLRAQAPIAALETLRLEEGQVLRWAGHLKRLQSTARHFGLNLDLAAVQAAMDDCVAQRPHGAWRLRLTVSAQGEVQVQATALAATPAVVTLALAQQPMLTHGPGLEFLQHKTTRREAYETVLRHKPAEAFDLILWNEAGELTECAIGNLALQIEGRWLTPRTEAGLLPGVFREQLLAEGRIQEARLMKQDLARAQGLAFFNSLRGWCPARLLPSSPLQD